MHLLLTFSRQDGNHRLICTYVVVSVAWFLPIDSPSDRRNQLKGGSAGLDHKFAAVSKRQAFIENKSITFMRLHYMTACKNECLESSVRILFAPWEEMLNALQTLWRLLHTSCIGRLTHKACDELCGIYWALTFGDGRKSLSFVLAMVMTNVRNTCKTTRMSRSV